MDPIQDISELMAHARLFADYWDEERVNYTAEMHRFVEQNPNLFGVVIATTNETMATVGAGFIDILRFGQGIEQSGWKGWAKDGLRLLAVAGGPIARGAGRLGGQASRLISAAKNLKIARAIIDPVPGTNNCMLVSAAKALTASGARVGILVEDLTHALGHSVDLTKTGINFKQLSDILSKVGIELGPARTAGNAAQINAMLTTDGTVAVIGMRGEAIIATDKGGQAIQFVHHAIMACKNSFGKVMYLDRGSVYYSIEELSQVWRLRGVFQPIEIMQFPGVYGREFLVEVASRIGIFFDKGGRAISVAASAYIVPDVHPADFHVVREAVQISNFSNRRGSQYMKSYSKGIYRIQPGDSLAKISRKYYIQEKFWPLIYVANRKIIGSNPSYLRPGMDIFIPERPPAPTIRTKH